MSSMLDLQVPSLQQTEDSLCDELKTTLGSFNRRIHVAPFVEYAQADEPLVEG